MKYSFAIIFFACVASAFAVAVAEKSKEKIGDSKSLSVPEKLALLTLSTLQPKKYGEVTWKSLFSFDDMPWIDYFFIDIRTLLVQSIKVEDKAPIPEIYWSYRFESCPWLCVDVTQTLTTGNTQMIGQNLTTSVNEVTPTTFKNSFHVPLFVLHSPDLLYNITDNIGYIYHQYLSRDLQLAISNLTLNTTFDYDFVEDLGIQISNLDIDFELNYLRVDIENVTGVYRNGTVDVYDPIKIDFTESLLNDWGNLTEDYLPSLELRINCVLSGSRNDPERCDGDDESDYVTKEYYKMNVVQLIQAIGLGSMDRY